MCAGRFANHAIWGWFIFFTARSSTQFYAGSRWFWRVVFFVDYPLVVAAVVVRCLGLLDADLAPRDDLLRLEACPAGRGARHDYRRRSA